MAEPAPELYFWTMDDRAPISQQELTDLYGVDPPMTRSELMALILTVLCETWSTHAIPIDEAYARVNGRPEIYGDLIHRKFMKCDGATFRLTPAGVRYYESGAED